MQLRLLSELCAGHALCHTIDAEMFPLDDSGYSTVQPQHVNAANEAPARGGVAICPERALVLESDRAT